MEENRKNFEQKNREGESKEKIIKEIHHHHYHGGNFTPGKIFVGLLVVIIGLVFLARNAGWIRTDLYLSFWKLWPIILILIGLSMISLRGWFGALMGVIFALILAGLVLFIIFRPIGPGDESMIEKETIFISKEAGAKSAIIEVKTGAGELKITGNSEALLSGSFESNFLQLIQKSELKDSVQRITLKTDVKWPRLSGRKWNELNLQINSTTPTKLHIDAGASKMDLDLTEVMIQELDINAGASSIGLIMGGKVANSKLSIDAGASSLNITLPRSLGARLTIDSALSAKNLNNFRQIDTHHFESDNYETSGKKVNIDLNIGASSLNIDWK